MNTILDTEKFGPWVLITGASSGIGKEFAEQLAANGFNLVLISRREKLLNEIGTTLSKQFGILYRAIEADFSDKNAIEQVVSATDDLEIGLLVSNAGTGKVGRFFSFEEEEHKYISELNAISHVRLVYHLGKKMAVRRRGGILLTGAMGAVDGIPYMATESGTKGYIQSFGKSLHSELKEYRIHVTVLVATPTDTPVFYKLGFTMQNTPLKPISTEQCVKEALLALRKNKVTVLPGLKFRIMSALTPGSLSREFTGKIMKRNNHIN